MSLYEHRQRQIDDDRARAARVSSTAFVARDKHGNELGIYDYGEGSQNTPLTRPVIEAGIVRGREAEALTFMRGQTDEHSRRLVSLAQGGRRAFNASLCEWVREWDAIGLDIPDFIDWQRKPG